MWKILSFLLLNCSLGKRTADRTTQAVSLTDLFFIAVFFFSSCTLRVTGSDLNGTSLCTSQPVQVFRSQRVRRQAEDVPPRFHPLPAQQVGELQEGGRPKQTAQVSACRRFPQCVKVFHHRPSATFHSRRIVFPFRFLRSGILQTSYKNIYRVTTGGMMLLAALHTCDEVHAVARETPALFLHETEQRVPTRLLEFVP